MRLLLDSNRFIAYCSGDPQVVDRLDSAVQIWVPLWSWLKSVWGRVC